MDQQTTYPFLATAAFGLEGVVAAELKRMGFSSKAEQGGARFSCSLPNALKANLWLRTADCVLMILAEKRVRSFEDLFQLVSSIPWESLLTKDAAFPVNGKCVRSQLMSVRDCQAISKKAICNRLQAHTHMNRFPETGATYPVDVSIYKDMARITLDMSGEALNRRGYRTWNGEAPLRETLAAALVELSPWQIGTPFHDPCCGTGTLLIEAAIKATKRAPGLSRAFACENFHFMSKEAISTHRQEAQAAYLTDDSLKISGSDISEESLLLCGRHIRQAGFGASIQITCSDLRQVQLCDQQGTFLTNPPYGERLSDQQHCRDLYRALGDLSRRHPASSMGVITSDPAFERFFGRRAQTKRRLYNGRLECEFFVFEAERP